MQPIDVIDGVEPPGAPVFSDDQAPGGITREPVDPDAPWGINPNTGRPYTISPEERSARGARLAAARTAKAASKSIGQPPPRKRTARQATGRDPAPKGQDYRPAIGALVQIPAMVLGILGRFWPSLTLDSWAITRAAPELVDVGHELLVEHPEWAATVERAAQIGPYGKAALAVLPLVAQLAANHRLAPAMPDLGVLSPEEMLADIKAATEATQRP
jgi:hypothetical protein